jgi:tRNA nucleotidyltransferase/poly(A) polymerase
LRGLSIHSFTNQPVRLLRSLRFAARLGLKFETRTKEWFDLAMDRELYKQITPEEAGEELKQLAREDKPGAALKAWETSGLLHSVAPRLAKKHPHYDAIARLVRSRDELLSAGLRPRLSVPTAAAILGKLKSRDLSAVLHRARFRAPDIAAILKLEGEGKKLVKLLISRKTAVPRDAYTLLEATPMELVGYVLAESKNTKAKAQIRNYISKWRPLRMNLPSVTTELEALGMERGPKFDKVVEDFFNAQLKGKAKLPEERVKILRKLSGIKEVPKKEEKKKPVKAAPSKGATKIEAMQAAKVRAAAANAVPGGKHVQVSKKKSAPKKAAKSAPKKSKPSGKKASSSKKRK